VIDPTHLKTIVVATRNGGKLREFRNLLAPLRSTILSLGDLFINAEPEESGATFTENARLKAVAYSQYTQFLVLADDSGLEVAALGGRPGILSARYAGSGASDSERVRKLLHELRGKRREARFFCALALARNGALLLETEGECTGIIAEEPRGTNGFGYDPIFFFPSLAKTYAELGEAEKNTVSHRSRAVAAFLSIVNRKS
jgi:non-canonical purine NTP pyrophosphatase (RdgB/HAM1 family)